MSLLSHQLISEMTRFFSSYEVEEGKEEEEEGALSYQHRVRVQVRPRQKLEAVVVWLPKLCKVSGRRNRTYSETSGIVLFIGDKIVSVSSTTEHSLS